jgi:predicted TIM-barrel fold metal-dependent hydrolase
MLGGNTNPMWGNQQRNLSPAGNPPFFSGALGAGNASFFAGILDPGNPSFFAGILGPEDPSLSAGILGRVKQLAPLQESAPLKQLGGLKQNSVVPFVEDFQRRKKEPLLCGVASRQHEPRRNFLRRMVRSGSFVLAGGKATAASFSRQNQEGVGSTDWEPPRQLIDTNVYIGQWPFQRLEYDQGDRLRAKLESFGVVQAWAGSFEALLHRDIAAVNARLVKICQTHGQNFFVTFPTVNPKLPDWREDLRQIVEVYRQPGIRLHPDYHGYTLDDEDFVHLLFRAAEANLLVQLVLMMEDERSVHPALKVPMVDPKPLLQVIPKIPGIRILLLNAQRVTPPGLLAELVQAGQVYVDIAWQEGVGGIENLLHRVPVERVVFGSYFPRFYFLSGILKLRESALSGYALAAIAAENARRLIGTSPC